MIKLESKESFNSPIYYFKNMKDCEEFIHTFSDHWCNVPWKKPVEVSDNLSINSYARERMNVSPKKRAEDDLCWGFSFCKRLNIDLSDSQNSFVTSFIDNLN